jgi:hypothetical protein
MLSRKTRVRNERVAEMDAAIVELQARVAAAEKAYTAVKRKRGKR